MTIAEHAAAIRSGDMLALSRGITLVESTLPAHRQQAALLLTQLAGTQSHSIRIGISGVPGVGKSTFIEAFGLYLISLGYKVAVLAVDPSSKKTGGSILGDKTRMEQLSVHAHAYIRPTAASTSLGGVAYKTREAIQLCEAAGFDIILVETVGVGQSETQVAEITDFFLLLMLAGAGDGLQGIKRGIMEVCDALVINKADGDNLTKAKLARTTYAQALHLLPPKENGWIPKVLLCSSTENMGMEEIWSVISTFALQLRTNGAWDKNRKRQRLDAFDKLLEAKLLSMYAEQPAFQKQLAQIRKNISDSELGIQQALGQALQLAESLWK